MRLFIVPLSLIHIFILLFFTSLVNTIPRQGCINFGWTFRSYCLICLYTFS
ncbi:hypothetical protein MBAV_006152 [Candidatus Magnetobacterium bavaricum]|uniref:Uncharacterized protein n=1 Tax=Candidatus Magnetobacterium bavaricum TaxID=29290 RepID=A0A0F3GI70_9BACT|nr:hypothetical protein MBAV_006152 [Candidatus Magnetobacterium bavaricum]